MNIDYLNKTEHLAVTDYLAKTFKHSVKLTNFTVR